MCPLRATRIDRIFVFGSSDEEEPSPSTGAPSAQVGQASTKPSNKHEDTTKYVDDSQFVTKTAKATDTALELEVEKNSAADSQGHLASALAGLMQTYSVIKQEKAFLACSQPRQ